MSDSSLTPNPRDTHRVVLRLLGAYADDELHAQRKELVEQHLTNCSQCRRELRAQVAVRARLMAASLPMESRGLRDRIVAMIDEEGEPPEVTAIPPLPGGTSSKTGLPVRWRRAASVGGWIVAASILAFWIYSGRAGVQRAPTPATSGSGASGASISVAIDSEPVPLAEAALSDFRRVASRDLPDSLDLDRLMTQVPFSVPALKLPHMRILATWTTRFHGQPVAAIAYRCHNRLVIQYVISEHQFFRPPRVRQAIAQAGLYAAGDGKIHALAWPDVDSGSFLVGEFTAAELAAMRS